jgi:RNA recognition motif-containing protein
MVRITKLLVNTLVRFPDVSEKKEANFMKRKLYVGNLNFDLVDEELENAFSQFGEIVSTVIIKDRASGRSKGFGFVEYTQEADAQKAKEAMNGKVLNGRPLRVDEAREPRNRNQRSGGYSLNRRW